MPQYRTPTQWKDYFGQNTNDQNKLLVDLLDADTNCHTCVPINPRILTDVGNDTDTYTSASLINKTVYLAFVDGGNQNYTYDATTGTITFEFTVANSSTINILYK